MRAERTTVTTRRSPGGVLSLSPVAALSGRNRLLISTCLVLITAVAWTYLVHLARQMSSSTAYETMMTQMGMSMDRPWTAADIFFTFVMWAVMMVGMMSGAAAPVLLLFAAAHSKRGERRAPLAVLIFGLGYLAVWVGFSACAAMAQWALHHAAILSPKMAASSPQVAGAILVIAGVYQLTPLKGACLAHCRSPLGFLMSNWREGRLGPFRMGVRHGTYCLGCCWALMCVLFVVGVLNLVWVAALTGFVLVEKMGPAGATVARVAGGAMVVVGMVLIAANA